MAQVLLSQAPETAPLARSGEQPRKLGVRWVLASAAAVGTLWLAWQIYHVLLGSNFHEVLPGRVYRGAQPSPAEIERFVRAHGIRTVVNLRGHALDGWFQDQCRTVQHLGIALENISLSATRLPSVYEVRRLVEVVERAEYPILLHCRRGADRTGLASAVVLLLERNTTYEEARRQLGLRFGHIPIGKTTHLDDFLRLYEGWLAQNQLQHRPEVFRRWVMTEYRAGLCHSVVEEFTPLQETNRAGEPLAFRVRVRHTGTRPWQLHAGRFAGVHVGFQVWNERRDVVAVGRAALFDRVVAPGETLETTVVLPPLRQPGRYRLLVDMVEENHCWFFQTGGEPREEELIVRE